MKYQAIVEKKNGKIANRGKARHSESEALEDEADFKNKYPKCKTYIKPII